MVSSSGNLVTLVTLHTHGHRRHYNVIQAGVGTTPTVRVPPHFLITMSQLSASSRRKNAPRRRLTRNPFERVFPNRGRSSVTVSGISSSTGGAVQRERFSLGMYRNLKGALNPNKVYTFVQAVELSLGINGANGFTNGSGSVTYGQGLALVFSLGTGLSIIGSSTNPSPSALGQYGNLAAMFDEYRISAVEVTLSMSRNTEATTATIPGVINSVMPIIHSAVDYDDATPPTTVGTMLQQSENNIWQVGHESRTQKKWLVKPKIAVAAYQGAFTGYAQGPPTQWIDTSYPNVQYYGLKFFTDVFGGTALNLGYATFHCRFFLEFKGVI